MKLRLALIVFLMVIFSGCSFFDKQKNSGIQVITNDVPSSVFINGQYLEKAPLIEKNIVPGEYNIRIEPDDSTLASYETTVMLRKGLLTVITWKPGERPETSGGVIYEMEPISSDKSQITFASIPDGAIISLDGGEKEFAPITYEDIEPGHHEFEVNLPSYETQRHTINALPGQRMVVNIKLAKLTSSSTPPVPTPTVNQETTTDQAASDSAAVATKSATEPTVTIQPTNFFQRGVEVLRVRATPDATAAEVGFVESGKQYVYTDKQDNWYQIEFDGSSGWVSAEYAAVE